MIPPPPPIQVLIFVICAFGEKYRQVHVYNSYLSFKHPIKAQIKKCTLDKERGKANVYSRHFIKTVQDPVRWRITVIMHDL